MTTEITNINEKSSELRYGFGSNWADYIAKSFSEERVEISRRYLLYFLKLNDLKGKTFLDIGCGSGLHSLAAWRSGSDLVVSFDYDIKSIETTKILHTLSGAPKNWMIMQGSILDDAFVDSLSKFDIVYSWGVLHHTGNLWKAIENAVRCLHASGVFYTALYSKEAYVSPPYEYWLKVKREYNYAGAIKKIWMECHYAWNNIIRSHLIHFQNPCRYIKEYKQSRGMSYWHDVRDWLGGYPMEFAGNQETETFCREKLGLDLIHLKAGAGNTEYLFRFVDSHNYWDGIISKFSLLAIPGPFTHVEGFGWRATLPQSHIGPAEQLMLYEDGNPVGWPNASKSSILKWGNGRYRVDGDVLLFSTRDNSDPNKTQKVLNYRNSFV